MAWVFGIRDVGDPNDISRPPNRYFDDKGYGWGGNVTSVLKWDSAQEALLFMRNRKGMDEQQFFKWMKDCDIQLEQF